MESGWDGDFGKLNLNMDLGRKELMQGRKER